MGIQEVPVKRANYHGADLHGKDFQGSDLRGADFGEAVLSYANLEGANLEGDFLLLTCGLSVDQLSKVKTLYNAKLEGELEQTLKEKYPGLFKKPSPHV